MEKLYFYISYTSIVSSTDLIIDLKKMYKRCTCIMSGILYGVMLETTLLLFYNYFIILML
jgi:hypothetical protein